MITVDIKIQANNFTEALSLLLGASANGEPAAKTPEQPDNHYRIAMTTDLDEPATSPEPAIRPAAKPVEPSPQPAPEPESAEQPEAAAKKCEIADVRAALASLRRAKNADAAKAILSQHGVSSVGDLPEDSYASVVAQAGEAMQ